MKHTLPKPKVVRTLDTVAVAHRMDFKTCPSCDCRHETDTWDKHGTKLVLAVVHGKHGSMAVVSECPDCFAESWVHHTIEAFTVSYLNAKWPQAWKDAARGEHTRRHVGAVHAFVDSLCATCEHFRKLDCDTHAFVECTLGRDEKAKLRPGESFRNHRTFPEKQCPAFKRRF